MKFEVLSIRTSHLWLLPWPALLIMSSAALGLSYSLPPAQGMKPWISAAAESQDVVVILSSYRFITRYPCCLWKFIPFFPAFILHGDVPQLLRKHLIFTEDCNRQCPSPTFLLLCMSRTWLISQDLGNTVFLLLYPSDSVRPCSNPLFPGITF